MGNRKRSAERLQAFKDKIRTINGVGASARMELFNDMFFDISFRLSKSCGMQDAIGDTEVFRIEYQRYCMYLSSGMSEFVMMHLHFEDVFSPSDQELQAAFDSVSSLDSSSESICSFSESEPLAPVTSQESFSESVGLPICQPIVMISEDQVVQGRSLTTDGIITGFINSEPIPDFNVSKLLLSAENRECNQRRVSQAPEVVTVLSLCERYLNCRDKIAVKLAFPLVSYRRPQCRDRANVVALMDPYALRIKGAEDAFSGSRAYNRKYLESKMHKAERSARCICGYPWTLSLFTEDMVLTREIVHQLAARYKDVVPKLSVNEYKLSSPVYVAAISRKLGEYGDPSFMINAHERVVMRSGGYTIHDAHGNQRLCTVMEVIEPRRMST